MAALISEHQAYIYSICLALTKEESKAELIKSAVMEKAWKNRSKFKELYGSNSFKYWIRRLCHNCFINHLRDRREKARLEDIDSHVDIQSDLDLEKQLEAKEKLLMIFNYLRSNWDEKSMNVFNLRILKGYKYEDIAQETGIPLNTVRVKLFRMKASIEQFR